MLGALDEQIPRHSVRRSTPAYGGGRLLLVPLPRGTKDQADAVNTQCSDSRPASPLSRPTER